MATKYRIVEETDFDNNTKFVIEQEYTQKVYKDRQGARGGNEWGGGSEDDFTYWAQVGEVYQTFDQAKSTLDRITFQPKRVIHEYNY